MKDQGVITPLDKTVLTAIGQKPNQINIPNIHLAQFNFKPLVNGVNPDKVFRDSNGKPIAPYLHRKMIPNAVKFERNCMILIRSPQGSFFTLPRPS